MTAYLESNHPELEPGSAEYVSYLVYDDGTLFMWMESSSWVNIADFYTYCVSKGAKIIKCNSLKSLQNTAKVGDIVQLKKRWQLVSLYYYQ